MSAAKSGLNLQALRGIGWRLWDPIGLNPDAEDRPLIDDEYDGYLLKVAGRMRSGASADECAAYLLDIEADGMGLGLPDEEASRHRAECTAIAIGALIEERK